MYTVMGVTGQVGAVVADALLARGERVRAAVRNPQRAAHLRERGIEIAAADFGDAAALEASFRDVEGAFVMIPPNFAPEPDFADSRVFITALGKALASARPPRVVCLSSVGAERSSDTGLITILHILEEELGRLPVPTAFLRAGWFMENALWDIPSAGKEGRIYSFLQPLEKTFPLVSVSDVGRTAADTLLEPWIGKRLIEVAGPWRYSPLDLASAFSVTLGRHVEAEAVPHDSWERLFIDQGTPADRTAHRIEMLDAFNSGWIDFGAQGTERIDGTVTLEDAVGSLVSRSQ